jgi:hypothetical protein
MSFIRWHAVRNRPEPITFHPLMKSIKIEIVQEGDERFILKVFADGSEKREPIVKLPRRKRYPPRPYWHWDLNKGSKKGF